MRAQTELLEGLAPLSPETVEIKTYVRPRILILGSMPSVSSLANTQYYAHPRNHFWPIMQAIFTIHPSDSYDHRTRSLVSAGVCVWDVIGACQRQGSLDSAIDPNTMRVNDIKALLHRYPSIERIACNGGMAQRTFKRHFADLISQYHCVNLLSSSPANARYSLAEKTDQWQQQLIKNQQLSDFTGESNE